MTRRKLLAWLVPCGAFGLVGGLFCRAVWIAREAARQTCCHGQMYFIYHALLNYHDANGHFPPAYVEGRDGTPWHSWRVLLLPYLEQRAVFDQYDFGEPWNGPKNRALADKIHARLFQCPSGRDRDKTLITNYCVVTGASTAFPMGNTTSLADPHEPESKAIVLVEIANSDIHWMEPRDLAVGDLRPRRGPRFGSPHPKGVGVVRANGSYELLDHDISVQDLAAQLQFLEKGPAARNRQFDKRPN
jgi:hypothetical protein